MSRNVDVHSLVAQITGGRMKQAAPLSEQTGRGSTTHPVGKVDDDLIPLQTGSHAAELEKNIKEQQPATNVNVVPDAKAQGGSAGQAEVQIAVNSSVAATGEDPAAEDNYKGDKDDPGTTSVMRTNDGEKYAAYRAMPLSKLASSIKERQDKIAATFAVYSTKSASAPAAPPTKEAAAAHGAALAGSVATEQAIKEAAAHEQLADIVNAANLGVSLFLAELRKEAGHEDDVTEGTGPSEEPAEEQVPPKGGGGTGGMGGGGGGPETGAPGGGGGLDAAIADVPVPGMDGGDMGGMGGDAPDPAAIVQALNDLGIDPHDLIAMAAANGAGGPPPPGAPAPGEGGMPKMAADAARKMAKIGHLALQLKASGQFQTFIPRPKTATEALYRDTKAYVLETLSKGRAH